ncbi:MAG: DNA polymerase III subunit delta [Bacteroidales bacterium]
MAQVQNKYAQIISDIKKGIFKPIYFLMGDEPYYIDLITDAIIENALEESERDFNQTILYGLETEISSLINGAKRYPMMSQRQLIVVKEAQYLEKIEDLIYYVEDYQPLTVLVVNYKEGLIKDKKLISAIEKIGIVYESKRLYDSQLPSFINGYVKDNALTIEPKAVAMLADSIGADLNRMVGELQKLKLTIKSNNIITAIQVEENIGISKDYNNYELQAAVINKDIYKVAQIAAYFEQNPKNNPLIVTISVLFNFFSNLLILYYSKDKTDVGISHELNLKNIYQVRDYKTAMQNYTVFKCVDIISYIREYDAKSKGIGIAPNTTNSALLRELLYKIMH